LAVLAENRFVTYGSALRYLLREELELKMRKLFKPEIETIGAQRAAAIVNDALREAENFKVEDIYVQLGTALAGMGLSPEKDAGVEYLLKPAGCLDFKMSPLYSVVELTKTVAEPPEREDAEKRGRDFWEVFRQKTREAICSDEGLLKLIKDAKAKEALEAALPAILALLGMTSLWLPVVTALVTGLLMLLVKTGLDSFCEIGKES